MRLLSVLCCILVCTQTLLGQDEASGQLSPDQEAIRKNAEAFVDAFNKADAKAVAALWAEQGEMSVDGEAIAIGRQGVEQEYTKYFQQFPDSLIKVQIDSIRVLGPTLAVERGHSEVVNDDSDSVIDAYRLVYTKKDDQWLIVSADVQQKEIVVPYDWKSDLGFLVGQWSATDGEWSIVTEFEWAPGGNFLKRSFTVREGGEEERTGIQIIGWDALEQSVVSWTFGADGGHGRGRWMTDGNQWSVDTQGVSPSGEVIVAKNVITVLGNNAFRWQSTNRSVAGVALDDTEPVTVKRVQAEPVSNQ